MLLAAWARHKWLAILAFAVPACAGISLIMFLPNVYRSSATVLVDRQQVPEAFVRSTVTSALETRLHTISQEILSRSRLEALAERFGLYRKLKKSGSNEDVIGRMRSDIKLELKNADVKGQNEATIAFTISYQGSDPGTVSAVTNTLAGFYIEENLKARERQAVGTETFSGCSSRRPRSASTSRRSVSAASSGVISASSRSRWKPTWPRWNGCTHSFD